MPVFGSVPPQGNEKHKQAPGTQPPEAPAPSQTSDSHKQARSSTTREFLARRHRAEPFKLLVSWVGAHSTPFCSRAPSPKTGPHGDGELFLRSIADNGSSWKREHLPCSAGSFLHHFAVSTSVDSCQRRPRAVARYVSAVEPGKVLNTENVWKPFPEDSQYHVLLRRRHRHRTRTETKGRRNNVQILRANSATWSCVRDTRPYSAVVTRIRGVAVHRNVGEQRQTQMNQNSCPLQPT